jgi:nucleoside-diphosphate-sugar epimerase
MSGQTVLVLGGTGAMGIYLVPELLQAGFQVVVTSRSPPATAAPGLRYLAGNARDPAFLQTVLARGPYDAIVDFMIYGTEEFNARRERLLRQTAHYLYLSSYRVFADSSPAPLTERSPRLLDVCSDAAYLATDEYALAKARQEDSLRASGTRHWTILRPGITYSRNRFQFGTLEADVFCYRARQGVPVLMAREILAKQTTLTWAGDVARLIARLVLNPAAFAEDYNVVTAEHRSWAEIAACYRDLLGLRVLETDLETYAKVVGGPYQIRYDRMFDRVLDNAKVLAATGSAQADFQPVRQGLARELAAYRQDPRIREPDVVLHARMDRIAGTRIALAGMPARRRLRYWRERLRPLPE